MLSEYAEIMEAWPALYQASLKLGGANEWLL